jgi:hypothetical protein
MKRCLVTGQVVTYPSRPVPLGMSNADAADS